ncbi:MAG: ribonuclease J, partial [Candidatus Obscuribacterales bacterium]|nr:ribonuclease J [Candidatus Obscuribacterales bacterium]
SNTYTPSEKKVEKGFIRHIGSSDGRVIVLLPGSATLRLQILFDIAKRLDKKVLLFGETLIQTAVAAAITSNLTYDRSIEASLADIAKIKDKDLLILATGDDGDAMALLHQLAYGRNKDLQLKKGDTVIFSSEIYPGESRKMALSLDQLLTMGVHSYISIKDGVHVSNHAGTEELKLMLALCQPEYFVPIMGEGRHIMHHCQLAEDFGILPQNIFPLKNGEILEISNGNATVIGSVEAQGVFYNSGQEESVTAFSVSERRALSMEGVLNVGILISPEWNLIQSPTFEGAALGFTQSNEWKVLKEELIDGIRLVIEKHKLASESERDPVALKASVREIVAKSVRSRLSSKPAIQVTVHELSGTRS